MSIFEEPRFRDDFGPGLNGTDADQNSTTPDVPNGVRAKAAYSSRSGRPTPQSQAGNTTNVTEEVADDVTDTRRFDSGSAAAETNNMFERLRQGELQIVDPVTQFVQAEAAARPGQASSAMPVRSSSPYTGKLKVPSSVKPSNETEQKPVAAPPSNVSIVDDMVNPKISFRQKRIIAKQAKQRQAVTKELSVECETIIPLGDEMAETAIEQPGGLQLKKDDIRLQVLHEQIMDRPTRDVEPATTTTLANGRKLSWRYALEDKIEQTPARTPIGAFIQARRFSSQVIAAFNQGVDERNVVAENNNKAIDRWNIFLQSDAMVHGTVRASAESYEPKIVEKVAEGLDPHFPAYTPSSVVESMSDAAGHNSTLYFGDLYRAVDNTAGFSPTMAAEVPSLVASRQNDDINSKFDKVVEFGIDFMFKTQTDPREATERALHAMGIKMSEFIDREQDITYLTANTSKLTNVVRAKLDGAAEARLASRGRPVNSIDAYSRVIGKRAAASLLDASIVTNIVFRQDQNGTTYGANHDIVAVVSDDDGRDYLLTAAPGVNGAAGTVLARQHAVAGDDFAETKQPSYMVVDARELNPITGTKRALDAIKSSRLGFQDVSLVTIDNSGLRQGSLKTISYDPRYGDAFTSDTDAIGRRIGILDSQTDPALLAKIFQNFNPKQAAEVTTPGQTTPAIGQ